MRFALYIIAAVALVLIFLRFVGAPIFDAIATGREMNGLRLEGGTALTYFPPRIATNVRGCLEITRIPPITECATTRIRLSFGGICVERIGDLPAWLEQLLLSGFDVALCREGRR